MELIMSVLIFTIASTICIQMFIKSHLLSEESTRLNHAVIWCESMAEVYYSADGDLNKIAKILDGILNEENLSVTLRYSDDYEETNDSYRYEVVGTLSKDEEHKLLYLTIECWDVLDQKKIYSINPALYPKEVAHYE